MSHYTYVDETKMCTFIISRLLNQIDYLNSSVYLLQFIYIYNFFIQFIKETHERRQAESLLVSWFLPLTDLIPSCTSDATLASCRARVVHMSTDFLCGVISETELTLFSLNSV